MPQNQPLTFEEFVARGTTPRWDGFYLYFDPIAIAPYLRQKPHFLDFQGKEPDLEARLTRNITNITNRDKSVGGMEALKPFEPDMYQAYLIMFEYLIKHNSVDPNKDLLISPK